jgi:hypothetical protein
MNPIPPSRSRSPSPQRTGSDAPGASQQPGDGAAARARNRGASAAASPLQPRDSAPRGSAGAAAGRPRSHALTEAPLALAVPGNAAMHTTRQILRNGPGNQAFALASIPASDHGLMNMGGCFSEAFVRAGIAGVNTHSATAIFDRKMCELFRLFVDRRLARQGPACPRDAALSSPAVSAADQPAHEVYHPEDLRFTALVGAGACNEYAHMTAWLAACEMAAEGRDGFAGVFELKDSEPQNMSQGFSMPHVVAGVYQAGEHKRGVVAPRRDGFLVLDAWQENASAMPVRAARISDRLDTVPILSFQVTGGKVRGVCVADDVDSTSESESDGEAPELLPVDRYPSPGALQALSACRVNGAELQHLLRNPESVDPSNTLGLTPSDRGRLADVATSMLSDPFDAGELLSAGNPFVEVQRSRDVAAVLHFDPAFAINNQTFGAVSGLRNDAAEVFHSATDSVPYAPRDHEQPYPGLRPSSPIGRERLADSAVTTDPMPRGDTPPAAG